LNFHSGIYIIFLLKKYHIYKNEENPNAQSSEPRKTDDYLRRDD
jgi:hypothetical protein